jgi:RNA polymerase sigma-70 factor (ECF subfamily)
MIAILTRIFGVAQLQLVEDVVQESFLKAMQSWKYGNVPNNPSAWLMQVAKNKIVDVLRKRNREQLYDASDNHFDFGTTIPEYFHEQEIADSQLRMIFTCAQPKLKEEDRLALTLKTVSGFSIQEIARALLSTEDAIQKRLLRARAFIKEENIQFEIPAGNSLSARMDTALSVLYLLFNEGYNSSKEEEFIRKDLCAEAMRLCKLLTEHAVCNTPSANALLALMCFHASRFESRISEDNDMILLHDQDRSKWDRNLIDVGYAYLNRSANGDDISVYHLESAIAAEHCMSASFEATNWARMLKLYDLLFAMKPTPTVQLNRSIVLAEMGNIEKAIQSVLSIPNLEYLLKTHYIYSTVLGDLYKRLSDSIKAKEFLEKALSLTHSRAERNLIQQKIQAIDPEHN